MGTTHRWLALALVGAALAHASAASQLTPDEAGRLLDESHVQGGLVVHVGCGDAHVTAALAKNERYRVQGLTRDAQAVEGLRRRLLADRLHGVVTVQPWSGGPLPYADNLVNLLIVEEADAIRLSTAEIRRVLTPLGVAFLRHKDGWRRIEKPWPNDIDEWTHFLHGPDNNAVAEDTRVGPPHHTQWTSGPRWGRSHDQFASVSAAVSSQGRIFYIVDEGKIASVCEPSNWMLVARNAFNGVLLWKRPVTPWENQLRTFRSGPAELPCRLVAVGDRVYVTLGYGEPVTELDAATGRLLRTLQGTDNAKEILVADGKAIVVTGADVEPLPDARKPELPEHLLPYPQSVVSYPSRQLLCIDLEDGNILWQRTDEELANVLPLTTAVSHGRVYFHNEENLVCLRVDSGETVWRSPRPISLHRYAWSVPTLVVKNGVVLSGDRTSEEVMDLGGEDRTRPRWLISSGHDLFDGEIMAFSAEVGESLWQAPCHESFNAPVDVFVARDRVWSGKVAWNDYPGITQVYSLKSGKVVDTRPPDSEFGRFGHHRCYRAKATVNYVLHSRRGIEFVEMDSDNLLVDSWLRGTCQYGILPCNGLIYTPPHSCACNATHQLSSFNALSAQSDYPEPDSETARWTGPAYDDACRSNPAGNAQLDDWPTYRRDETRGGASSSKVGHDLLVAWQRELGGRWTAPVVADGRLLIAQPKTNRLVALDATLGRTLWEYAACGPIDSPPTVRDDFLYFGTADGCVTCLRAMDGALAWRTRVAPSDRQVVAYDQIQSTWPISGSVLVRNSELGKPTVYGVAGRSTYLDGGMILFSLDARDGTVVHRRRLFCPSPELTAKALPKSDAYDVVNVLPDVLTSDGQRLFMRQQGFAWDGTPLNTRDPHLFCSVGFLDDTWWHRTYWQYGTNVSSGYGNWIAEGNRRVSGRLLVMSDDRIFGFGRKEYFRTGSHPGLDAEHHLFGATRPEIVPEKMGRRTVAGEEGRPEYLWSRDWPFHARAMVLAGDCLLAAGPEELADLDAPLPRGAVRLCILSPQGGKTLAEYPISASPEWDAMAVARGRVFLATVDGRVTCFEGSGGH